MSLPNPNRLRNTAIIILSYIFINQCSGNLGKQNVAFCKAPAHSPTFDINYPYENEVGHPIGWHFLLGNLMARKHFSEILRGRALTSEDEFTGMCAKAIFQNGEKIIGGQYRGHGPHSAQRNCTYSAEVLSCDLVSFYNPDFKDAAKIYVTYINGEKGYKHLQVVVYCFENGDVGWVLGALRKSITDAEKEIVLNHISSLGFEKTEVVPLYTEYCDVLDAGKSYWYPSFPFYHPHPVTPGKAWTAASHTQKGKGESDTQYGWGASSTYLGWRPPSGWASYLPKGWSPPPPPPKGWPAPDATKGWGWPAPPDATKGWGWPAPPDATKGWGWPAPPDATKGWGWPAPPEATKGGWGWPAPPDATKGWGWPAPDYNKPWGPPNFAKGWGSPGSTYGWGWPGATKGWSLRID